jgi:hypothetical protein
VSDLTRAFEVPFKHGSYRMRVRILDTDPGDEMEHILDAACDAANRPFAGNASSVSHLIQKLTDMRDHGDEPTDQSVWGLDNSQPFVISVWGTVAQLDLSVDLLDDTIPVQPIIAYLATDVVPIFALYFCSYMTQKVERNLYGESGLASTTSLEDLFNKITERPSSSRH